MDLFCRGRRNIVVATFNWQPSLTFAREVAERSTTGALRHDADTAKCPLAVSRGRNMDKITMLLLRRVCIRLLVYRCVDVPHRGEHALHWHVAPSA